MSIERTEGIRFHEQGTLEAVTRWIANHADGISEWFKNVRRQYQVDRANVPEKHRVALLLLKDAKDGAPARAGVLDVGGATLEDVTAWTTWQDPDASKRGSRLAEEETQGNGGKAYMYRLFSGPARILGVKDRRRNCMGFEGDVGTVQRGTPGWVPNVANGRDVEVSSWDAELRQALQPFDLALEELPPRVLGAIKDRQAFTLVEGIQPTGLYKGRIDADDLLAKVARHEQSILSLEQVDFFVAHNGRMINDGKKLTLPAIAPYPGIQSPMVYEIPDQLPLQDGLVSSDQLHLAEGQTISTTEGGTKERGRLILHTSADNMSMARRNLRPRWQMIYRTKHQMIGAKPMSDLAGTTPGAAYVYGTLELPALEPGYVEHGRRRPKDGPLVEAVDHFIAEKVRELARLINEQRKEELDERSLDEVHDENRKLDDFKNQFLPADGQGAGNNGTGPPPPPPPPPPEWGDEPDALEYSIADDGIHLGRGVSVGLRSYIDAKVRDAAGRPVRATIVWQTSDSHVAAFTKDDQLTGREKGNCEVWAKVKGTDIESERIPVRVWNVDHVLLTPRTLDVPVGMRQQIVAEVTDDDGDRSTTVVLDWRHDADDQLIVRINRIGFVTGNRLGRTAITAGAGDVWARIPVEVTVLPNPKDDERPTGYPRLLLTGRDLDPATNMIREGDPDQPALWQETSDYLNNVWWLNLQNPEAAFSFRQRPQNAPLWRTYHANQVVEMVVQVWMGEEFTKKGDSQPKDYWAGYFAALVRHRVRVVHEMWKRLEAYVTLGDEWTPPADETST